MFKLLIRILLVINPKSRIQQTGEVSGLSDWIGWTEEVAP